MRSGVIFVSLLVLALEAVAQTVDSRICQSIALLPADMKWTEPMQRRERFELRNCGDSIVVLGYQAKKRSPTLNFETGDGYPRYLTHSFNVLVLQSMGGSADHVYVFAFQDGKPSLVLKTATKDLIQVKQGDSDVTVLVPPVQYPDSQSGKVPPALAPKTYVFRLQY